MAVKIHFFQHIARRDTMFTSNSQRAIHDSKDVSAYQTPAILLLMMEGLCNMTTWHEGR